MVEADLNYLAPRAPGEERPFYYTYPPPAGEPWRNTKGDRRTLPIHDARELARPSLDREGFDLVRFATAVDDLYDADAVRARYYKELEELVAKATGAPRVVAFDHNVRCEARAERGEDGAQAPVRFVHNDYTLGSGPRRVRDLMGDEAEALLAGRFAVVNVWKPIVGPVQANPLAILDGATILQQSFVETDLKYRDRDGEIYSLTHEDAHRWYYYPAQRADEVLLLKCYDSDASVCRFTAHSSFDDPSSPEDPPSRESIEVRTLAFWAAGDG